jgi:polar amino acid transport system substrate-binding protein
MMNVFVKRLRSLAVGLITIAVSAAALAGLGQGASAQTVEEIVKRGKVQILIDTTNPPYGTVDDKMQPSGYEVEIAKSMAKALGVELEIVPVTSANRIPFLQTNKADILLSTLTVTPQRAMQVWYTAPYALAEFVVIAAKDKSIKTVDDIKSLKIGVIRGGATDTALVRAAPAGTQIQRFDDLASTTQALVSGQVDAIVENWLVPGAINKLNTGKVYEGKIGLQKVYFSMAVRKGSTDLLQWVNTFLFTFRTSGDLSALHERLLGMKLPELPSL